MAVFNLPDDIFPNKGELIEPIIIHRYFATSSKFKERSILHRNAISLVIRGKKTIRFAESCVDTNDREIHFLSSGNSIASFDISDQKVFESILIFFDDKVLTDFIVSHMRLVDDRQKKYQSTPSRYISFRKDNFINTYIQSMALIVGSERQYSPEMMRLKLWELLLYLLENYSPLFLSFLNRNETMRNEVAMRKLVEANVVENLSLEDMAFLCNVSVSTFKRQFKKIYNTAPTVWFTEQRMNLAVELLTNRKERPGEIWFKLGYQTHTSFTKSFKKHFGVSPKEYLERLTRKEHVLS